MGESENKKINEVTEEVENNETLIPEESNVEEIVNNKESKPEGKGMHFIKVLLSGVFDQIVILAAALIIFFICSLVIRIFGYTFVSSKREAMFGLLYFIGNIVYYPLLPEFLKGKTVGKKILFK